MVARAEKYNVFASVFGKYATLYRRAAIGRPYDIIDSLYDKLKFAQQERYRAE